MSHQPLLIKNKRENTKYFSHFAILGNLMVKAFAFDGETPCLNSSSG